ncbi:MAG: CehA/McbA family metallohydrolase [Lachnospiraceae bacterium]|nr:CehA/McbA family metallohydrolase [Lachnospiraceae bacterium]
MYKRLELHNHTTESDASITARELLDYMLEDQVDGFAVTDHNTISGQEKIVAMIREDNLPIGLIKGMEVTTYYGHILGLNLTKYIPWEDIDLHKPEKLFRRMKEAGALVGVAHPFSYGAPFARGCRFDMTITDFSDVDYIEISNDLEPLHEVNERGLLWWQELLFNGEHLAASAGMDLHGKWDMSNQFATFIEGTKDGDLEQEIRIAIESMQTWISKGPLLILEQKPDGLHCHIEITGKPGDTHNQGKPYRMVLNFREGDKEYPISPEEEPVLSEEMTGHGLAVPKLYRGDRIMEDLVCVAPPITL